MSAKPDEARTSHLDSQPDLGFISTERHDLVGRPLYGVLEPTFVQIAGLSDGHINLAPHCLDGSEHMFVMQEAVQIPKAPLRR